MNPTHSWGVPGGQIPQEGGFIAVWRVMDPREGKLHEGRGFVLFTAAPSAPTTGRGP